MRNLAFALLLFFAGLAQAQIPSYGKSDKLDVACWNIKWFGDVNNGPNNESLQFSNVLSVFRETKIDLWALSEISNNDAFQRMLDSMPRYQGIIAPINQTQKTALLYDSNLFTLLYSKLIITSENYDFASGRFPFEVALVPKYGNASDTLITIVIHLKANVGSTSDKQQSWQRRQNASNHLKSYLDQTHPTKKIILLGDFNDDTDTSIHSGNPSPFNNFINDNSNYTFLTKDLSLTNVGSTVGRTDMIDHQMVSDELFNAYTSNSCQVLPLQNYLANYSSTTSDHYPVFASYSYQFVSNEIIQPKTIIMYPNPLDRNQKLKLFGTQIWRITTLDGREISRHNFTSFDRERKAGVYLVHYRMNNKNYIQKLSVVN